MAVPFENVQGKSTRVLCELDSALCLSLSIAEHSQQHHSLVLMP